MFFTLPDLPYPHDALEPFIDEQTMHLHHEGHHQAYINNLNKALHSAPNWQNKSLEDLLTNLDNLPNEIQTTVRNNAGGHYNHSLLWQTFIEPNKFEAAEKFEIGQAIIQKWQTLFAFKQAFNQIAASRFGSGFAWLVLNNNNELQIISTPNQDNPLSTGLYPLFGMDVWEHAYYLKYNNRRPEYLDACWQILNWKYINQRYLKAIKA